MRVGYIRTSTEEQNLDMQRAALLKNGCEKIFEDQLSGKNRNRPGLISALDSIKEGDVLVIWRLDRLSRKLKDILDLVEFLKTRKIKLFSITEDLDTSTATGNVMFQIRGVFAEWERATIGERVRAGMAAAKAKGVVMGPPRKFSLEVVDQLRKAYDAGEGGYGVLARRFGMSKSNVKHLICQ